MNVYVNEITGTADAITTMYFSRGTWTRELEMDIRDTCNRVLDRTGSVYEDLDATDSEKFNEWIRKLMKYGVHHTTMLRYIDFSITVEGLHRAGQDDWDSHAARFNNRIIRSSSRMQNLELELSDWYKDKAIPTEIALEKAGLINKPQTLELDGKEYVSVPNGYVLKEYENNKDVKRGLYPLGFPSNFIFKVNLTEFAHVYKQRNGRSGANPEVKLLCETICDELEYMNPWISRDLLSRIEN